MEKARSRGTGAIESGISQKLPITITGMALFNAYTNGRYNGGAENTVIAPLTPGDATGGGSLRQSIIGLQYDSPQTVFGGKVTGAISLDLFGGSAASLDHLVRLRTATISLDWNNTSILFGQDKPIISPRDPNSFAQVGVSPLTGAGNLWLWQPQIRMEQRFNFGNNSGVRLQVGVVQTRELGNESSDTTRTSRLRSRERCRWNMRSPAWRAASKCGGNGARIRASKSLRDSMKTRAPSALPTSTRICSHSTG